MSFLPRSRPLATYRLQFNREFTLAAAADLVPYLHRLGVSHCYASPLLKARAGSMHGYDIVDHRQLNPELGERADFDRLVDRLHEHGMGLIVDIVPNHMGVGGSDNAWWQDVLENGPAAEHADFFDIDWRPAHETLRGKVLLPLLGERYGEVLDKGEIRLVFTPTAGSFHFAYYEHQLPLDPVTYPAVAAPCLEEFRRRVPPGDPGLAELENLLTAFAHLPGRETRDPGRQQERRRDKEITKQRLAELGGRDARILALLEKCIAFFNDPADPAARGEGLHELLEKQVYRPAHWVVAGDEINYRRFFDINSLAGLQAEREEVFAATHELLLELVAAGQIDGLRVDHPDGLSDPAAYFSRLQAAAGRAVAPAEGAERAMASAEGAGTGTAGIYLVVEKILAAYEHLPEAWPVNGTTGYDFTNQVNGLLVYPGHEAALSRIYHRFIGRRLDFDELLYQRKKMIVTDQLSSELTVLARLLNDIAEADRHTRDFTLNGLREALIEVTACFPVYRTYIAEVSAPMDEAEAAGDAVQPPAAVTGEVAGEVAGVAGGVESTAGAGMAAGDPAAMAPAAAKPAVAYQVSVEDRRYVEWALAQARKRGSVRDTTIYDFLHAVLLADPAAPLNGHRPLNQQVAEPDEDPGDQGPAVTAAAVPLRDTAPLPIAWLRARFIRKFQQYTAPVMAKSLEDTTFYLANRLLSLNEVGGDPRRFYVSPAAFHHAAQERLRRWPQAMLATFTHDSKRSEDVRARINVLSEVPELWRGHLQRWRQLNRSRKSRVNGRLAPTPNDEYFFYQTLLGSWPLNNADETAAGSEPPADYRGRIREYMLKAVREAKTHTSWLNPDAAYEEAVAHFVEQTLTSPAGNPFLADFAPLVQRLAPYGLLNALVQVLLKLTTPGVPDIYQGAETWAFSLVDPDNRRPVDYHRRQAMLAALPDPERVALPETIREMLGQLADGRLKLFLTSRLLHLRRQWPELFLQGDYLPLVVEGGRRDHVCGFIRQWEEHRLLVVTGRWFATLAKADGFREETPWFNPEVWADTALLLPDTGAGRWQDLLTGEPRTAIAEQEGNRLTCADLFATIPMAVLYSRS